MSFLEHLEVMRWHLLRSIAAIVILALVAFVFKDIVFDKIILAPKEPPFPTNRWLCQLGEILGLEADLYQLRIPSTLQTVKMAEQFSMHIIVSLVAGMVVAFPYIFWEFWRFIVPALYDKEKNTARGAVFYTSLLFILGVLFGYYIIAPLSVNFLGNYKVSESVISAPTLQILCANHYLCGAGCRALYFSCLFWYTFLSKVGLVTPGFLKKYRRHSLVIIVTLSAIITPPDVFSQVLVALPLMILYEIGIAISKRIVKEQDAEKAAGEKRVKRKKKAAEEPETEKKKPETGTAAGQEEESEPEQEETAGESDEAKEESPAKSETKEEVSTKKPWKRPASKPGPEEGEEPGPDTPE